LNRKGRALLVVAVIAVVVVAGAALLIPRNPSAGPPPNCTRPPGGYLIIASKLGFNDSIDHGVPANNWPVITVRQGQEVNITVCNTDIEAHGFQITHYFEGTIEAVAPGQVVHTSFVADQVGDFKIYCSIFCSVHAFMQGGLLRVSS